METSFCVLFVSFGVTLTGLLASRVLDTGGSGLTSDELIAISASEPSFSLFSLSKSGLIAESKVNH